MTDGLGPIHQYVRKQKPRVLPHLRAPAHTIAPVPRAVVSTRVTPRLDIHHQSNSQHGQTTNDFFLMPSSGSAHSHHSSRPSSSSNAPPANPTAKPRKRFRKKANGLFGDQTDLKKRMDKLLRKADASEIVFSADAADADIVARHRDSARSLPAATSIIEHLTATSPSNQLQEDDDAPVVTPTDSFDFVELTETARNVLGSPEKFSNLRKVMGKLSPRSNDRFLEVLDVGRPPQQIKKDEVDKRIIALTPPVLPMLNEGKEEKEDNGGVEELLALSSISVDRTGAPAVLRRKARRLDRGYRCVDVLRSRLQGAPTRDTLVSPPLEKKLEPKRPIRTQVNIVCPSAIVKLKENGRKSAEDSLTDPIDGDDDGRLQDRDRRRYRARKRRRIIRGADDTDVLSMKKADEVSLLDMYDSDNDSEGRQVEPQNPLKMLVEAATAPMPHFRRHSREEDDEFANEERKKRRKV